MRFGEALKEALKYHAVAIVPTLIGVAIALGSLWIGVIDPFLEAIAGELGEPTVALERAAEAEYGLAIAVIGVVVGLLIRRIGRTALLFRTHGNAVVEEVDREIVPDAPVTEGAPENAGSEETHRNAGSEETPESGAHGGPGTQAGAAAAEATGDESDDAPSESDIDDGVEDDGDDDDDGHIGDDDDDGHIGDDDDGGDEPSESDVDDEDGERRDR